MENKKKVISTQMRNEYVLKRVRARTVLETIEQKLVRTLAEGKRGSRIQPFDKIKINRMLKKKGKRKIGMNGA